MNILIVENDLSDLHQLTTLLEQWSLEKKQTLIVKTFSSGESCIASDLFDWPDVCILDIALASGVSGSSMNGIETAKALRMHGCQKPILFLTAFREYVFDGYKVHAMDYLLKPLSYECLAPCLQEIEQMMKRDTYLFRNGAEIIRLTYADIISIHSSHHQIELTTATRIYTQRIALTDVLHHLPREFVRCHRTCIVNLAHITSLSHSEIQLSNMTKINIGRAYLQDVIQKFSDYSQHLYK